MSVNPLYCATYVINPFIISIISANHEKRREILANVKILIVSLVYNLFYCERECVCNKLCITNRPTKYIHYIDEANWLLNA